MNIRPFFNIVAIACLSLLIGVSIITTPFLLLFVKDVGWWWPLGPLGGFLGILGIMRCDLSKYYACIIPIGIIIGIVVGFIGPANWLWSSFFRLF